MRYKDTLPLEYKLFEYLDAMHKNNDIFIGKSKEYNNLKFSDGYQIIYLWSNYQDEIINLLNTNPEYKAKYPDAVKELYNIYAGFSAGFEKKVEEFLIEMDKNDNLIIGHIKKNSNLIFSDGSRMNQFWNANKDNIIKFINMNPEYKEKHPKSVQELFDVYTGFRSGFRRKFEEYINAMDENGNNIIPISSTLRFKDGSKMSQFLYQHKKTIIKFINLNPEYKKIHYKSISRILDEDYKFIEKLEEYLSKMDELNFKFIHNISTNSNLKFSDGKYMKTFWPANKEKIISYIKTYPIFYEKHKKSCNILCDVYNGFEPNFRQKLEEYLCMMDKFDSDLIRLLPKYEKLQFYDKTYMMYFGISNKERIIKFVNINPEFKELHPKSVQVFYDMEDGFMFDFRRKLDEYLDMMDNLGNVFISNTKKYSDLRFYDKTHMNKFWIIYKKSIYKFLKMHLEYGYMHPESVKILLNKYKHSLTFEEKVEEYLIMMECESNKRKIHSLTFSDGTKINQFMSKKEEIILFLNTHPEVVEKHKESVKVLLTKINTLKNRKRIKEVCTCHKIEYAVNSDIFRTLLTIPYEELDSKLNFIEELGESIQVNGKLNEILTMSNYEFQNKYSIALDELLMRYKEKSLQK